VSKISCSLKLQIVCKKIISTKGYAEIHIQRPFFDSKIVYEKYLD
jgi:hypothetical protein